MSTDQYKPNGTVKGLPCDHCKRRIGHDVKHIVYRYADGLFCEDCHIKRIRGVI